MLAWSRGLPVRIRYFPVLCIHISIYDVYIYLYRNNMGWCVWFLVSCYFYGHPIRIPTCLAPNHPSLSKTLHSRLHDIWMFPKILVPLVYNGNPIKMDDLGVPLFLETPICTWKLLMYIDVLKVRYRSLLCCVNQRSRHEEILYNTDIPIRLVAFRTLLTPWK